MNRFTAIYIIVVFSFLFTGCLPKQKLPAETVQSSNAVQNEADTGALPAETSTEETANPSTDNSTEVADDTKPVETAPLTADPSLETPIAKEAIDFFNDILWAAMPPFFSSPNEVDKEYAETIALLHSGENENENSKEKDYPFFISLSDVENSAKSIFGNGIQISHNGSEEAYSYKFISEKNGYAYGPYGIEHGYESVPIKCEESESKLILYVKLIRYDGHALDDGYFDYDTQTYLSEDYNAAAAKSKSPLYQVTLTKKSDGGFTFTRFGAAPLPKDPSLETPAAKEAIDFFNSLLLEEIPPFFSSLEDLDPDYAEIIALLNPITSSDAITEVEAEANDSESFFYKLSDVETAAELIFGKGVQISHKGAYAIVYNAEKQGYDSTTFGIETCYVSVPIRCSESESELNLYTKLIFETDSGYYDYDRKALISEDYNEAVAKTKSPLYQVTLTKKPEGGFFFTGFQLADKS